MISSGTFSKSEVKYKILPPSSAIWPLGGISNLIPPLPSLSPTDLPQVCLPLGLGPDGPFVWNVFSLKSSSFFRAQLKVHLFQRAHLALLSLKAPRHLSLLPKVQQPSRLQAANTH